MNWNRNEKIARIKTNSPAMFKIRVAQTLVNDIMMTFINQS